SLLRRSGVRARRFRLRNGLGTFALVVKVAGSPRVRLFAVGTKFSAHRIMIVPPNAIVSNWQLVSHTVEERASRPFSGRRRPALDPKSLSSFSRSAIAVARRIHDSFLSVVHWKSHWAVLPGLEFIFSTFPSARILEDGQYHMPQDIAPPPAHSAQLDDSALEAALRRHLRGEVRFDTSSRALYATDGSNYRQVPIGVVVPRDKEDVLAAVALCRDYRAPLLARGGGTSLAGQCCNAAVILDFSKYMAGILEIDPARRIARVEPGVVLDNLRAAAEKHHLTFAPDPATHDRCTLGGMIGNNSCGVHSIMAGKTDDNIESLEVVTYGGQRLHVGATTADDFDRFIREGGRRAEIYAGLKSLADRYGEQVRRQFPNIPRRVSGYNLNHLLPESGFHVARALVGSEGTCVTILEATCRLVESPPARVLLVIGWPDVYICADHVPQIMEHRPIGLEGFDDIMVNASRHKGVNLD